VWKVEEKARKLAGTMCGKKSVDGARQPLAAKATVPAERPTGIAARPAIVALPQAGGYNGLRPNLFRLRSRGF